MSRKTLGLFAGVAGLVGAALLGFAVRRAEDAHQHLERAERLLSAPIERAPALEDLRATEARALCDEALELHPSDQARACIDAARAIERLQHDDSVQAEVAARRALAITPKAPLLLLLTAAALADRDPTAAQNTLAELLAAHPDDARALALASDIARKLGRADEALQFAARALTTHPGSAVLHERAGQARELLGESDAVRTEYELAAKLDRKSSSSLLELGRFLRDANKLDEALLVYREAKDRDPNRAEAWLGSGLCRAALNDRVGARLDFEQAEQLALTQAAPLVALADLDLSEGDLQSALRRYRAASKLDKRDAAALVKLGNALVRAHTPHEAVLAFRSALELAPDLAQAHNGLGAALWASGDSQAAATELGAAATLDRHDPNPLLNLALLRKQAGDRAGAQLAYQEARTRDPNIHVMLLDALSAQSDHGPALASLDRKSRR